MSITFEPVPEQAPVTTVDVPVSSPWEVTEEERREILLKAAGIIETNGWSSASGMDVDGPFCLLGAIAHAAGTTRFGDSYAMDEPAAILGVGHISAYSWNDTLIYTLPMRRKHFYSRKERLPGGPVVVNALRQMANGASWNDATRLPKA